jgi:CYTH domain-containing protein
MTMRTAEQEMRAPKYAHVERERRWLVDATARPFLDDLPSVLIEDRYVEDSRMRLRRMTDSLSGRQSLKLTKKYEAADPLARPIVTAYLDEAEYALLAALPARALVKRRFTLADGGHDFSLDRFEGPLDGLELIEIEQAEDAALRMLSPPIWAGREVSDDARYQGGTLARHGNPEE